MLVVSLRNRIRNVEIIICKRTKIIDIAKPISLLKWQRVGSIAWKTDGPWGIKDIV